MVRISKQAERRSRRPHRTRAPALKTGAKKDNLPMGFKEHANAISDSNIAQTTFIGRVWQDIEALVNRANLQKNEMF